MVVKMCCISSLTTSLKALPLSATPISCLLIKTLWNTSCNILPMVMASLPLEQPLNFSASTALREDGKEQRSSFQSQWTLNPVTCGCLYICTHTLTVHFANYFYLPSDTGNTVGYTCSTDQEVRVHHNATALVSVVYHVAVGG